MREPLLRVIPPEQVAERRGVPIDAETLAQAATIVEDVRVRGVAALREYAECFDGLSRSAPLVRSRAELEAALSDLAPSQAELLKRVAGRIRAFAQAQKAALTDMRVAIPGGSAGHTVLPLESAGCYAPGERFPLPSSVLMTALTARVAGVKRVWAASPRPTPVVRTPSRRSPSGPARLLPATSWLDRVTAG
jgi:histidinol dehydrogenase